MLDQRTEVESLFRSLDAVAPGQLRAVHHYVDVPTLQTACESNEHWVAVTTRSYNIHEMRAAFRAQTPLTDKTPIIVSAETFPLYLKTHPVIAEQLAHGMYFGQNGILAQIPASNWEQKTAHFALRFLQASSTLTSCCDEASWISAEKQLDALSCAFNVEATHPQQQLAQLMSAIGLWSASEPAEPLLDDAPACLPELQAIYEELDSAILVLPNNAAAIIQKTDWQAVIKHFSDRFDHLQITTTAHLELLAHHHLAVGFAINRFQHAWGRDLLAHSPITNRDIVGSALQFILSVGCDYLPHRYFTLPDDELNTLIHDVQNQLLKVQLQYDLLCMLRGLPSATIPTLSNNRTLPITDRIDAIQDHICHWVDYYQNLLQTSV